jgi:hypothetical protein
MKEGSKRKRKLLLIGIPLGLIILFFLFAYNANYSKGVRSGVVIKMVKKGVIFKTMEGQLNLESFGALKSNNNFAETFNFSVEKHNDQLHEILNQVSLSGERVNLHYKEKYIKLFWRGDTKYFVYEVERSGKPQKPKTDPFE